MSKIVKISVSVAGVALALGMTVASAAAYTFTAAPLTVGSRGADVQALQVLLNQNAATQVAATGAGSPGNESTYFGAKTAAALAKYQKANGIKPASGYFGKITQAFVNNAGGVANPNPGTGTTTSPTASGVTASLAADNTPAGSIVAGAATAELARFNFSGTGVVTNLKLQRIGLSTNNSTLQNVYLYAGATRLTDSGSVASDGSVSFNAPNGLFTVAGSKEITVRADLIPVSQGGQTAGTVGVSLTGFTVGGVAASVGITGNQMVIVNTTPASASFNASGVTNPGNGATVQAGTSNFTLWSQTLQVSTRAVNLKAVTFRYIGSAPASAISNIHLYVDGAQVGNTGTIAPINGTSYIVFDLTSTPYTVTTGSHTVEVRADVVGGANYSFTVSLQNAADIMIEDSQLPGTFVSVVGIPGYTSGNSVGISAGTNSVTVDPNFTTTTVTGGATNVPVAQFKFTGYGEDTKILSLNVTPKINGSTSGVSLNNVSLYANGAQVGSTQNFNGTALTFNLGSSLIVPNGQSVILTVKADLVSSSSVNVTSGTLTVNVAGTTNNAQGMSSQQTLTIPSTTGVTSNGLTIGANSITVAKNASLTNQSVSPNTANTKIGSFIIQAGSAEGLQVTNIVVGVQSTAGGVSNAYTNLSNLKIVGNGINVIPVNPVGTNNFSTNFSIAASGSQTIDVYADLGALTGTATTTLTVTGRGTVSNVSTTTAAINGQLITIAQGGVTSAPTIVSSATLPSQFIIGPSSPTIATYNIISTSTNATIQELRFSVAGAGTVAQLAISAGGVTATAPVVSGIADFTGLSIPVSAGYGGVNLTLTPTYASVGGTNGIASNSFSTTTLVGIMSRSGNSTTQLGQTASGSSGSLTVTGEVPFVLVSSKPTVSINSGSTNGLVTGQVELADVTVSADQNGNIKVEALPISITTSGAVNFASTTAGLVVKDANNNTITVASATFPDIAANSTGTTTISFAGGYQVGAGSSQVFKIFANAQGVSGNAGTQSVATKIGTQSLFKWDDVNGNATNLSGSYITNFPSATHTTTN
ncbi:MAG: peptidoglycan-binding domain-containing protein [bacterium]